MEKTMITHVLLIVITAVVVVVLTWLSRRVLNLFIKKRTQNINADPTNFIFLKNSVGYVIFTMGVMWVFYNIPYFKALGNAMFAGAGVFAAVIAFASQKAFSNIIGGLFILIFKPFRVGDLIEISNSRVGVVEEITLRHTIIKDFEFRRVVIPNSVISDETIINSSITDDRIKKQINFSISYDSNIDLAMDIIKQQIKSHPLHIDNRSQEDIAMGVDTVIVRTIRLGDSSVDLRAYVWTRDYVDAFILQCDIFKSVKEAFEQQGVEIPYPHRTLVSKSPQNILT